MYVRMSACLCVLCVGVFVFMSLFVHLCMRMCVGLFVGICVGVSLSMYCVYVRWWLVCLCLRLCVRVYRLCLCISVRVDVSLCVHSVHVHVYVFVSLYAAYCIDVRMFATVLVLFGTFVKLYLCMCRMSQECFRRCARLCVASACMCAGV